MKLRAVGGVSIRDGDGWLDFKDGEVFEPPAHMDTKSALRRGICVEVKSRKKKASVDESQANGFDSVAHKAVKRG